MIPARRQSSSYRSLSFGLDRGSTIYLHPTMSVGRAQRVLYICGVIKLFDVKQRDDDHDTGKHD